MTRTRTFVLIGTVLALLIAGVGSWYASSAPDGLEATAEEQGFGSTARDSAAADSPLADYTASWIGDDRLSGGLAGVIGVLLVLALTSVLVLLVRRRPASDDSVPDDSAPRADARQH
ncbi:MULTISPECIES: PDGLE domain-containing protein [unclassified Modestobacter]|uniref:PDGLE domain-containing protein n=1 Tax=unclassified Modestobacter TaxID=2643866 RepID=UPI0022AAC7CA|nr:MULTISPECIES: PDGLE domain-containing protein [unclassified Modestobacter]MCZ2824082.1 PDGLE domain-containing protein [Modestobacter sp. VKM Ac-2981]MCZ2852327.1 PDGLE domain-containing protein [Modestobacter sp. VKM Ac-2982]